MEDDDFQRNRSILQIPELAHRPFVIINIPAGSTNFINYFANNSNNAFRSVMRKSLVNKTERPTRNMIATTRNNKTGEPNTLAALVL